MVGTTKIDSLKINILTRDQYDEAKTAGTIDENQIYMIEGNDSNTGESNYLLLSGGTMVGALILHGDPTNDLGAATKQYVDAIKNLLEASLSSHASSTTVHTDIRNEITSIKNGYVQKTDVINIAQGGTGQNSIVDTTYTTARYRASALVASETSPTQNGVINWMYE